MSSIESIRIPLVTATPHAETRPRLDAPTAWCLAAAVAMFLAVIAGYTFVDLDLFHEMAWAREFRSTGRLPLNDPFAYSPTIHPVIHHEWGTGVVLYAVAHALGAPGIMALKYCMTAAVAGLVAWTAHKRATWPLVALGAMVALLCGDIGFTTIRAQLFTLLFSAVLLVFLELDRQGHRWWIAPWLLAYVVWLNLHAGFVTGLGIVTLYALEETLRERRIPWRFGLLLLAMAALVVVNPFGWAYPKYVWFGITLPRPRIHEWQPIWHDPSLLGGLTLAAALAAYGLLRGYRRLPPGFLLVPVTCLLAVQHLRHISLFALMWLAFVPGWLQTTPMQGVIAQLWERRRKAVTAAGIAATLLFAGLALAQKPWAMKIPSTLKDRDAGMPVVYPAGAVAYLREQGFRGNVMTPFQEGAYVMWQLYPNVKVGLDSRYEVAYPPEQVDALLRMYKAEPGWRETLAGIGGTDLLLVSTDKPLSASMPTTDWRRVYRDDCYELWARPGLELPHADWRGVEWAAQFP